MSAKVVLIKKAILQILKSSESHYFISFHFGRGDRTRTCDSLVPNQERYQLRYTSLPKIGCKITNNFRPKQILSQLFDNSLLNKDFFQGNHRTVNLLLRMSSHQCITHQSILRRTSRRYDRINKHTSFECQCRY